MEHSLKKPILPWMRPMLLVLFALQPLLDILSYWSAPLHIPDAVSIVLRASVFFGFAAIGFLISDRKKLYLIGFLAAAALLAGHVLACARAGYQDPAADITNYMRVMQLPLFTGVLITCLRRDRRCARTIEKGLILNFWIITVSVVLSLLTHTASVTYGESGYGVIGWFATTNAQSSILSMLVPIVIVLEYRRRIFPLFCLTAIAGFAQLYFIGTRLAFLTIPITWIGLVIAAFITKNKSRRYLLALGLICVVCLVCIRQSPMYRNQTHYIAAMASKQSDSSRMIREGTTLPQDFSPVAPEDEPETVDEQTLEMIYNFYAKELCGRFGTDRVMEIYDYTRDISAITATRQVKIHYCEMLMEELPELSRWFGIERSRMIYNGFNYDAENDFHGIYFLYGYTGLAMVIAFLACFIYLIIKSLLQDFTHVFTLEAAGFGMAFLLAMVYAYHTAGLLRRPNASFYLSVILAYVYHLVKLRRSGNEAA